MRTLENETGIAKPELRNKKCEPGKTNEIAKPEIRNKKCETGKMELELRNKKCETEKKKRNCETGNTKQEMRMAANFLEWNYLSNASRQTCGKLSRMNLLKECIAANFLE